MTVAGKSKHCHHGNVLCVLIRELLVFLSLLFFGCWSCGHYLSPDVFIMLLSAIHNVFDSSIKNWNGIEFKGEYETGILYLWIIKIAYGTVLPAFAKGTQNSGVGREVLTFYPFVFSPAIQTILFPKLTSLGEWL